MDRGSNSKVNQVEHQRDSDFWVEIDDESSDNECGTDGEDSECDEVFRDSDFDEEADDRDFAEFVDVQTEFEGAQTNMGNSELEGFKGNVCNSSSEVYCTGLDDIFEDPYDSDDLKLLDSSDDENKQPKLKFSKWNPKSDFNDPKFELGMEFDTHSEFRNAVKQFGIKNGKCIQFKKSDRKRVRAVCKDGCPWMIYASFVEADRVYRVKTFEKECTCSREFKVPWVSISWVLKQYGERIRINPTWPIPSLIETIRNEWNVEVSAHVVRKAKKIAIMVALGNEDDQYKLLWGYMEEVRRTNPGTTICMKVKRLGDSTNQCRFKRLYVCWGALIKGYKEGCRPLIALDGCHLKGPQGGILLTAVTFDANNCIYPFAYAVVEQEKQKTWLWFLDLLARDIAIVNSNKYTFMSDRQKGLINAVESLFPDAEHRFCVRHMYNNFKTKHFGPVLKELFWKCARATNIPKFTQAMENLKNVDNDAYDWLCRIPPTCWSRAHFSTYPKCDVLLNNLSESFNAVLLKARDKPIVTMLERIRLMLMESIHRKRDAMLKVNGPICPKIQKIVEKSKEYAGHWNPIWNGGDQFELMGPYAETIRVDLAKRECACRKWQLTGIPCVHVISAIYARRMKPEDFVHDCYKKEAYMLCYDNLLNTINGSDLWPKTTLHEVLPPIIKKRSGRPKGARRKEPEVPDTTNKTLGRKGRKMTCSVCKEVGHNKAGCKVNKQENEEVPKSQEIPLTAPTPSSTPINRETQPEVDPKDLQGKKRKATTKNNEFFPSKETEMSMEPEFNNSLSIQVPHEPVPNQDVVNQTFQQVPSLGVLECDMQPSYVAQHQLSWRGEKLIFGLARKSVTSDPKLPTSRPKLDVRRTKRD